TWSYRDNFKLLSNKYLTNQY
ncbi:hypothetical protein D043_1851B, partial [Vibrio parahaemolyticus EKP-021]